MKSLCFTIGVLFSLTSINNSVIRFRIFLLHLIRFSGINMKKLFSTLIIFFSINTCFAQNYVDVFKLNYNSTPLNKFDSSANSTKINEISADFTFPKRVNDKLVLISGGSYESIQTRVFENQPYLRFSSIGLKLGFNRSINPQWTASLIMFPKISSDFVEVSRKDFQIGGITMLKYSKRSNLNYKIALYGNSELFGPILVPLFGMYYLTENGKWETNLMLPLQADVNYKITSGIALGLNFNGQIRSYHLTNTSPVNYNTYVNRSSNELCAYLKFNLARSLSLQTKIGYSLGRSYRVYKEDDKVKFALPLLYFNDQRKQLNTDFENGILFQFQVLYRVQI